MEYKEPSKINRFPNYLILGCTLMLGILISTTSLLFYDYLTKDTLGAGFSTFWIGVLLIVISGLSLVQTKRGKFDSDENQRVSVEKVKKIIFTMIICIVCMSLVKLIGMAISITLLIFLFLHFLEGQKLIRSILVSITCSIVVFFIFDFIFKVQFPNSLIGF
ncbi:hypothetical protein CIL05_00155 [Virgibacillus profundi]|uniref:DUF1468 domain-containing protein n=1 Tax=Virgibacillus profundi TaxID=2024555 RepID=A0A2A2IHK6_9BACI|nr:tripartite tricarboxylate transporter TctB family protein [Virgibacillus profundi]PAV31107.1 hypothetical protein CIL05_00155 [Virgibacillus profundi]PXY55290.1 hypothetical protein CIT14_00155 [Virgibacillus profundi]